MPDFISPNRVPDEAPLDSNGRFSFSWLLFFNNLNKRVRVQDNYANDAAAEAGGISKGGQYHTAGTVKIRIV